ncbi:MAG: hypothetical protein ABI210_10845 [Abditibacteriaceae bacterium]
MSNSQQSPEPSTSPRPGLVVAGIGILLALLMYQHPEHLHVPIYVGMMISACFVLAGAAMAVQSTGSVLAYQVAIVCLLACMTAVPAWIAFGPGERHCTTILPFLSGQIGCRVVFGFGTLIMLVPLVIAVKQLLRTSDN